MIIPGDRITSFRIREPHRKRLLDLPVRWGHGGLGEVTFRRTYSRALPDGTQEDWNQCVVRVIEGMFSILRTHAAQNRIPWREERGQRLALEAAQRMQAFKWTPPGRGLWMMGTDYVYERGGAALNNCAFVSTNAFSSLDADETVEPFRFLMDAAMLGVGPGFDTLGAGKLGIQGYNGFPIDHVVQDSREGWVEAAGLVIRNGLFGGPPVRLDDRLVRPEGAILKGFGGVASGPRPLVQGLRGIEYILMERRRQSLCSVTITDIMNILGKIVVAGNVRRTAEIGFSVPGDLSFAKMKDWQENPEAMGAAPPVELREENPRDYELYQEHQSKPGTGVAREIVEKYAERPWAFKFGGWRWCSNNSILANVGMDYAPYDESIAQSGEPGFVWLDVARGRGRLRDGDNLKDVKIMGFNPCAEQPLESYEICNLVENYPAHAEAPEPRESYPTREDWAKASYWDWQRSLKFSYLYAKTVTLIGTHWERTNEIIARNRRIGCSISGAADAVAIYGRTTFFRGWCDDGYKYIRYLDRKYSDWLGVRESVKDTTVKPSGTVSLVAGVYGPGAHFPKRTGYRTMRIARGSLIVPVLEAAGYRVEPSVTEPSVTVVAYFPWIVPAGETTEEDVGLWEQVKFAADLQYWWSDNGVSYTAVFSPEEAARGEIGRVLSAFDGQLKGISFLPRDPGGYAQMPFTAAPLAEVERYAAGLKPLDWGVAVAHEMEDKFCDGGACEVRAA